MTKTDNPVGHRIVKPEAGRSKLGYLVFGRVYANGNIMEGNEKVTRNNWDGGVQVEDEPDAGKYTGFMKWNKPFPMPLFPIMSAREAYTYVLDHAGATFPRRDPVDTRVIKQVKTGEIDYLKDVNLDGIPRFKYRRLPEDSYKKGIITDVREVGGYPEYKGTPYKDTDKDGMPDEWEEKYGLNPNKASDANGDLNGDGYTNIEEYINGVNPKKRIDWTDPENDVDTLDKLNGKLY